MLPEKYRLKINKVRSKSWVDKKELYTPFFKVIAHLKNGTETTPRIGFIVGGKIKGAVNRNRVRRLFTEVVRSKIGELPERGEILIVASKKASEASYEDISNWISNILSKLHKPPH